MMQIHNVTIQELMQSDLTPFCEMRQILLEELHISPESVCDMEFRGETRQIPPEEGDEWERHESTGRQQYTLILANGGKVNFIREQGDVHLGELPKQ